MRRRAVSRGAGLDGAGLERVHDDPVLMMSNAFMEHGVKIVLHKTADSRNDNSCMALEAERGSANEHQFLHVHVAR